MKVQLSRGTFSCSGLRQPKTSIADLSEADLIQVLREYVEWRKAHRTRAFFIESCATVSAKLRSWL